MSSKTTLFLSTQNEQELIKTIYQRHVADGGQKPLSTFKEQIPHLMRKWKRTPLLDTYESLVLDPVSELENINRDFVNTYWPLFSVGDDYKSLPRLDTPADYHNMDTGRVEDVVINQSVYRDNNAFPVWQRSRYKYHDRSAEGNAMQGRSLDQAPASCGDLDELLAHTDKPYRTVDQNDVQYYGQHPDEGHTAMTSNLWRTE